LKKRKLIEVIITSYNEPKATLRAVKVFLNQTSRKDIRVTVVDPFPEVEQYLNNNIKDPRYNFYPDPGEGKNFAFNLLFDEFHSKDPNDILIFTDGDVYVSENTIEEIMKKFEDPKVGCVTGQPISVDSRKTRFGYWSKVLLSAIHKVRIQLDREKKFFQASGYLFAIRNSIISGIPLEVPEDAIMPYFMWKRGFRTAYAENAKVFVKYPENWPDWLNQRTRTIKAHENISKSYPDMPRTKSLFNEMRAGVFYAIRQPRTPKEFIWTLQLYFARLYIYYKSFVDMKTNRHFNPAWREDEVQSTKPLD
jgi:cellulose synthase/poly-beta-1,6-N-acetylglucosamine synthase-like glycosyltransferase